MDLNIIIDAKAGKGEMKHLLETAFELGYGTVALNTIVDSSQLSGKNLSIPEPKVIDFKMKSTKEFRVLNRITASIEDNIHCHNFFKSPVTKKYDIVALQPIGEKMLQYVCSLSGVDIISINMTENLGYFLKRTYLGLATTKNICFEITYAPCLRNQSSRRNLIGKAQELVEVTKGKNVFVSSGATRHMELRSVEDVMNLALLFGFQKNQAEASVRKIGKLVLKHARTRNETGCGYVSLTGMFRLPKHQGWIVNVCKVPKPLETSSSQKRTINEVLNAKENKKKKTKSEMKLKE
ncbi:probable ribonuclease P protein subunit 3 [Trichonephila inaurata madagascariensis]|uniref:Probable ribonuclease P protein subunit 3 n=1 Tax=Trichonephila inaurata madagascariensis TaxID=2747483 RepID=A0A8X6YTT3_9ARAC|nr:probable ribonuclease P protein subunit 3 [Trichonephila inaurata madagascariensis]